LECSGAAASAALLTDGALVAEAYVNAKITHSQTLLKMASDMLNSAKVEVKDIDGFAVSAGPGSFTGIRIGISAVKGLAQPFNKPCVAVSSLSAIAENFKSQNCLVCAVLDARCNQVYNALFKISDGVVTRLTPDRAMKSSELAEELAKKRTREKIIVAGDGSLVFYPFVKENKKVILAQNTLMYQRASGVATCSEKDFLKGNTLSSKEILPIYLRLPQAERELKAKRSKE
jgi:tRNA threonylcarbamoyladenosine biosynthesis protein TsaB